MHEKLLKRLQHRYFPVHFAQFNKKTIFTEHLRMTIPADSSVPTKVLFIDHTFSFFSSFYPFIIDNCNYGSLFREGLKIKIFFHF